MEITITAQGYLQLPAEVVERHFPGCGLVALLRGPELWLLPTRGPAAGGLLIKRRNRQGDGSVLLGESLPPDLVAGPQLGFWDARQGALRVAIRRHADGGAHERSI
jgi:hypothetical protein